MSDSLTVTSLLPALLGALAAAALVWVLLRLATRGIDRLTGRLEREGILTDGAVFATRLTRFVRSTLSFVAVLAAMVVLLRGIGFRRVPRVSAEDVAEWLMGPGLRLGIIATWDREN